MPRTKPLETVVVVMDIPQTPEMRKLALSIYAKAMIRAYLADQALKEQKVETQQDDGVPPDEDW